jgi:hypothetical protein
MLADTPALGAFRDGRCTTKRARPRDRPLYREDAEEADTSWHGEHVAPLHRLVVAIDMTGRRRRTAGYAASAALVMAATTPGRLQPSPGTGRPPTAFLGARPQWPVYARLACRPLPDYCAGWAFNVVQSSRTYFLNQTV